MLVIFLRGLETQPKEMKLTCWGPQFWKWTDSMLDQLQPLTTFTSMVGCICYLGLGLDMFTLETKE